MSADVLRRAAALMRKDKAVETDLGHIDARDFATWSAVADWLTACASVMEVAPTKHKGNALAVARAYLNEQTAEVSP